MGAYGTILLLIALGRLFAAGRVLPDNAAETLNRVVIVLCLPALIFIHVPTLEPSRDLLPLVLTPWMLLGLTIAMVLLGSRVFGFSRSATAVLLVLIPLGNTSFLGFPLVEALLGADKVRFAVVYDQFGSFLIVCTHVLFVVAWYGDGPAPTLGMIVRRIVTFPPFAALVGALLLGNAWFPDWLMTLAEAFADMLLPLVTLAVGLQLRLRLVPEYRWPLAFGLAGKLVILPAAALLAGLVFRVESPVFEVAVLESAMPPMITAAALASSARLAPPLASAMVAWGVLFSAATVPFWHWLVAH
ncbi:MAG: AEC family transporter [Wenzhouxiangellaceae bacterium]|nr:AEC family transporter [Wenzhouxiangellaceae bacterium]MBS3823365.1 AEC family transporter [Wenzhouxiangellaceae bacterium]